MADGQDQDRRIEDDLRDGRIVARAVAHQIRGVFDAALRITAVDDGPCQQNRWCWSLLVTVGDGPSSSRFGLTLVCYVVHDKTCDGYDRRIYCAADTRTPPWDETETRMAVRASRVAVAIELLQQPFVYDDEVHARGL